MSIFPHVVAGAAVGSVMPNLPLAVTGGIISHIIVDLIPHWDPQSFRKTTIFQKLIYGVALFADLSVSLIFLWFVFQYPNLFWGGLLGALTDLENFLHLGWFEKIGIKIDSSTKKGGWQTQTGVIWGTFTQSVVIAASLLIIYFQGVRI